ncbi:MAG: hypothetical protein AAFV43_12020 [Planctomycetota bacterium]
MATARAEETSFIDPNRLYTYVGFIKASGVAKSRIREARLRGIQLETINAGRRKFVPGRCGIEFIERLAALDAASHASNV